MLLVYRVHTRVFCQKEFLQCSITALSMTNKTKERDKIIERFAPYIVSMTLRRVLGRSCSKFLGGGGGVGGFPDSTFHCESKAPPSGQTRMHCDNSGL